MRACFSLGWLLVIVPRTTCSRSLLARSLASDRSSISWCHAGTYFAECEGYDENDQCGCGVGQCFVCALQDTCNISAGTNLSLATQDAKGGPGCCDGCCFPSYDCCEFFSDQDVFGICHNCSAGSWSLGSGQLNCTECAVGKFGASADRTSESHCDACSAGDYQNQAGQASCNACPAGQFQSLTQSTSCNNCTAGMFSDAGKDKCEVCEAGRFGVVGNPRCTNCPAGKHQPGTNASSCQPCELGTFSNKTANNATRCEEMCARGSAGISAGKTRHDDACAGCETGKFQSNPGQSACKDCKLGQYALAASALNCKECPPGKFQDLKAKASCENCPKGT